MNRRIIIIFILASAFLLTQLSTTLFLPALPHMVLVLHSTSRVIMLTLSVFFLGYALGQLFWGSMSDRFGRKPMLSCSLLLYMLAAVAVLISRQISWFFISYAVIGFAAAAYTSIGNAIIKDLYDKDIGRPMSYIGMVLASGGAIGPFAGGYLLRWFNWYGIFVFLGFAAVFILFIIYFIVPETSQRHRRNQNGNQSYNQLGHYRAITAYAHVLTNRTFISYILTLGLCFGTLYAFIDAVPFIFMTYLTISLATFTWLFALASLGNFFGAAFVSLMINKIAPRHLVLLGMAIAFITTIPFVFFALSHSHQLLELALITFFFIFGLGMALPATKIGAMTSVNLYSGTAASLMKFTQTILCMVFIVLAAQLHQSHSILYITLLLLTAMVMAVGVFLVLQRWGQAQRRLLVEVNVLRNANV